MTDDALRRAAERAYAWYVNLGASKGGDDPLSASSGAVFEALRAALAADEPGPVTFPAPPPSPEPPPVEDIAREIVLGYAGACRALPERALSLNARLLEHTIAAALTAERDSR